MLWIRNSANTQLEAGWPWLISHNFLHSFFRKGSKGPGRNLSHTNQEILLDISVSAFKNSWELNSEYASATTFYSQKDEPNSCFKEKWHED